MKRSVFLCTASALLLFNAQRCLLSPALASIRNGGEGARDSVRAWRPASDSLSSSEEERAGERRPLFSTGSALSTAEPQTESTQKPSAAKPVSHTTRDIEGWTVRVDDRLLNGADSALGTRALKLLTARLVGITAVMPEKPLAKLREVPIQLDLTHGMLRNMQYHPSAGWLKSHGYSETLARCVHLPDASYFVSPFENHRQPWAVLHELAHAYHDRVLGFDEPRILAAWKKFRDSGRYKSVLTSPGGEREHYALTDQKEFFAEMTECYFGANDFYPFVAGELKQAEPEIFALLREIWGPLPSRRNAP